MSLYQYDPLVNKRFNYNEMIHKRENIKFNAPEHCKKCGKPPGNHLTNITLDKNPNACKGYFNAT